MDNQYLIIRPNNTNDMQVSDFILGWDISVEVPDGWYLTELDPIFSINNFEAWKIQNTTNKDVWNLVRIDSGLSTAGELAQLKSTNNDLNDQLQSMQLSNAQQLNNLNKQLQTTTLDFAQQLNALNKQLSDKTGGE